MQYAKDICGRFGPKNDKIKTFDTGDIENMSVMLTVLRGRMLGLSWRELSELTGIDLSTLFDRCSNYLGDMIVKYDFRKENLPDQYQRAYRKGLSPETKGAIKNTHNGTLVPMEVMRDCLIMNDHHNSIDKWLNSENGHWNSRFSPEVTE